MSTTIQWTDETWNPMTGCTKVSSGCKHCYAETVAKRLWKHQYGDGRKFTDVMFHVERLRLPFLWRKPRRVFVNSMSDLFHEDLSDAMIDTVFAAMLLTPRHTYQVLTKRPKRMRSYLSDVNRMGLIQDQARVLAGTMKRYGILTENVYYEIEHGFRLCSEVDMLPYVPNVWLGVSVEDQETADLRIPLLINSPAYIRFLSVEPLLDHVSLMPYLEMKRDGVLLHPIEWVICGGESGNRARPCHVSWIDNVIQECDAVGVAVFVKQLGRRVATDGVVPGRGARIERDGSTDNAILWKMGDSKGGDMSEWCPSLQRRDFPDLP